MFPILRESPPPLLVATCSDLNKLCEWVECMLSLCLLTYFKVSKIPVPEIASALSQVLCQHRTYNYPLEHYNTQFTDEKRDSQWVNSLAITPCCIVLCAS